MHHSRQPLEDLHAGLEQRSPGVARRVRQPGNVAVARHHHPHVDPPAGGALERSTERAVGDEVRRLDPDALLRRRHGVLQMMLHHPASEQAAHGEGLHPRRGTVDRDGCRNPTARRGQRGIPVLRLRVAPAHLEEALQLAQHRAFDLRVHVVPAAAAPGDRRVVVAQVHPSSEGDASIDDHQLAVVAHLPAPAAAPGTDRMEDREQHAGGSHPRHVVSGEPERARSVDHAAHPDAFLRLDADGVDETAAVGVARPDVRLDEDLAAGEGDGIEHGGVGPGAAEQPVHPMPGQHPLRGQAKALQFARRRGDEGGAQGRPS